VKLTESGESFDLVNDVLSCRGGMLEFFGSDEKLDKAGIQMKNSISYWVAVLWSTIDTILIILSNSLPKLEKTFLLNN